MHKIVAACSSEQQTNIINNLLNLNKDTYTLSDVMNYLPQIININNEVGYLRISPIDIVWSSLETEQQGKVVKLFQHLTSDRNIYDSFIDALNWWISKNNK